METREVYLPLHHGKAPYWLLSRMKKLARPIVWLIINEYGEKEIFKRLSDPIFFQSFSNILGFDWNSSGSTTVLIGVLKSVFNNSDEFDIKISGGKGTEALRTPDQIKKFSEKLGISDKKAEQYIKISRLVAKMDNSALQDGYDLYHHAFIFSRKYWTVIQQGMNVNLKLARRYHWNFSKDWKGIDWNTHSGIVAERKERSVINLLSEKSSESRKLILDIIKDRSFKKDYRKLISIIKVRDSSNVFLIPRKIDWRAVEKAYNLQPDNFEDFLLIKGIGKGTLRALALISDLIYNVNYDKEDPAKYSFALGGKDGVPFPVHRERYDEVIEFMQEVVKQTELGVFDKKQILAKLRSLLKRN